MGAGRQNITRKERKMDTHTQTLLGELTRRWLALGDIETQEVVVMLLRAFSLDKEDVGDRDLPHYREAVERQDRELTERYTTFGQLAVGDRFFHFGREYEKTEPSQTVQWVNCQSDKERRFLRDDCVVERAESQDTQDRILLGGGHGA
jgi:hypothetical protein